MKGDSQVIALLNEVLTAELAARILFLEGVPNLQKLGKVDVGQTVPEQLQLDLAVEYQAVKRLNEGIELCRAKGDSGSGEILEHMLVDEEEHVSWLEAQKELIGQVGEQNYLAEQIKES